MKKNLFSLFFCCFSLSVFAQPVATEGEFHFNPYKMTAESQISAAKLNHPITEKDRISVSKDGHLEANGSRIRIFGTNLSEFPSSHTQAAFSAQALANQGYNCIRFHHTDANWTNCFLKKNETGKWVINQKRLDDFDYFFYELKQNGIYSNINFLTGRSISSADGYKKEVDEISEWKALHDLAFWDDEALLKQQEYAAALMNHVNPYTGIAYKDDPAVAIVEINNENGMLMGYLNGWLDYFTKDYWTELETQWNVWLEKNGHSYDSLAEQYNRKTSIAGSLINESSKWNLEQHEGAKASISNNNNQTTIKIEKNGKADWHVQYNCPKLKFESSKIYQISFSVKASKNTKLNVSLMQAHDPWANSGFNQNLNLTTEYQTFSYTVENIDDDNNLRINFGGMGLCEGTTFYLKDITITEGGSVENIKSGRHSTSAKKTVELPHYSEFKSMPAEYKNLILNFMWDLEQNYWITMKNFVRDTLNSKALIMGTAAGCSTTVLQSCFDIIDSHAYWHHPTFPGKSWDMGNYYVRNKSLTKSDTDSTLENLAKYRVYGKPFSVSEYDHPYPNQYNSEAYSMIASFGALQDWDCIFTFCSELPKNADGQNLKINGYFDQSNNPAKSCAAPIASRIFRQFLVEPAKIKSYVNLSEAAERKNLYKNNAWSIGKPEAFGSIPQAGLIHQIGINLLGSTPENFFDNCGSINLAAENSSNYQKKYIGYDDSKQIYWNQETGIFIVLNENVSVTIADKGAVLPAISLTGNDILLPAKNLQDFISVAAVKDVLSKETRKPYLVFACSWVGNKNENLREYGKKTKSNGNYLIRDNILLTTDSSLGRGPVYALSSACTFEFSSKTKYKLYKMGLDGNAATEIPSTKQKWNISADSGTLWYIFK